MPKRLTISILLVTISLAWMVPYFIEQTSTMTFSLFDWALVGAYCYMVFSFYYVALSDLKSRWK